MAVSPSYRVKWVYIAKKISSITLISVEVATKRDSIVT